MRKTAFAATAATLFITIAALTNPAAATDTTKAISICVSRGPDCAINNKSDGSYQICVNNSGGKQCVTCPALGSSDSNCSVAAAGTGGKKNIAGVDKILTSGKAQSKSQ